MLFDSKLMEIIKFYGIPTKIAINMLYTDIIVQVLSPNGNAEFLKIFGVLQGDTLL